jgi:hypothetical protein
VHERRCRRRVDAGAAERLDDAVVQTPRRRVGLGEGQRTRPAIDGDEIRERSADIDGDSGLRRPRSPWLRAVTVTNVRVPVDASEGKRAVAR